MNSTREEQPKLVNSDDSIQATEVSVIAAANPTLLLRPPKSRSLLERRRGAFTLSAPIEKQVCPLALLSDRYKVLEKIGSGSAGVVHRAIHLESGLEVALKAPRATDSSAAHAAKREYELLKRLEPHPHIVKLLDFHNLQREATLVLQFFEGVTLQAAVQEKRFAEPTARSLGLALFKAVAHLHKSNILHRDIKPQNVLVSHCRSNLLLIDLNAAACLDDAEPLTPTGTELYKAPELLLGEIPCERSDVWASGLCVFFMMSGNLPQGRHKADALKVALQPISFEAACWQHVSEECQAMLKSCLSISRDARPSMAELLEDAWLTDPMVFQLISLLTSFVPGSEAYLRVFSFLKIDAFNAQDAFMLRCRHEAHGHNSDA